MASTFAVHPTFRAVLFWLLFVPCLIAAQTTHKEKPAEQNKQIRKPAKNAHIVDYPLATEGSLQIRYSDGTDVEIPKERGRFGDLTQEAFSDIQLADDAQHLGWLADYMICAQSYPCHADSLFISLGTS